MRRTVALCGEVAGPWAGPVRAVFEAAAWQVVAQADLTLALPGGASCVRGFAEAEALNAQIDDIAAEPGRYAAGELYATRQLIVLFDGRIRTLRHRFALRSAVDAARADLVQSGALRVAPGARVNGISIGPAPEGPDQRDDAWHQSHVSRIEQSLPKLSELPAMVAYLDESHAVTGQIIRLNQR